jgi:hypothetical protein
LPPVSLGAITVNSFGVFKSSDPFIVAAINPKG